MKIDKKFKYSSYLSWKKYVYDKYIDYSINDKIEFSRYLNQRIRNIVPEHEAQSIVLPILMSIFLTWIFSKIVELDYSMIVVKREVILVFVLFFGIFIITYIITKETILPLFEDNIEKSLLEDYKEIIDEMIKNDS